MIENPYAAPASAVRPSEAVGVKSGSRADVRSVAVYQKGILVCILVNLAAIAGMFVVPPPVALILFAVMLVSMLAAFVFVVLLAMKVYNAAMGIILGIGSLLPFISLIVLLMVNGKANRILRENGHRVGLLGADLSKF
ncbi:hypothetical protein [Tautonia plasticadhaerens]|uniref:Uncharacterized protein n=1 Tax=Tautonia plasticadhaerens TaxID=2527974 RepID=A0A518GZC9_9BACT|nr:hypothetical protein [Tautonia plasticadhaerens]QDV33940.1 hypothetical protein ElP_18210 [Tautonia plasticadhaerens]